MKRIDPVISALRALLLPAAALIIAFCFFIGISNLENGEADEGRRRLEDALRRSSVACYAAEGIYPPDIEYLEENYGLQIDRDRYTVYYDVFASNLMPDITVLENES